VSATDVALQPLAASGDVDLYNLQSYTLSGAATALGAATSTALLIPGAVSVPTGGSSGGGPAPRGRRRPPPPPPALRVPQRRQVHVAATAVGRAAMSLTVHPYGRRAEEDLVLDLI